MSYVGAIIVNPAGLVLLQLRDQYVKEFPLCWTLFGGTVPNELSNEQALQVKLKEELRLTASLIKSCWLFESHYDEQLKVNQAIYVVHTVAEIEQLILKKGLDMKFFRLDQVFEQELAFNVRTIMRRYEKIA